MPKTIKEEIQGKISSYATIFGDLQETIRLELIHNNKNFTDYLRQDKKGVASSRIDNLTENLKKISDILNGSQEHYEISFTDSDNKTFVTNVGYPFDKDSVTYGIKRGFEAKFNDKYKGQNLFQHQYVDKLYGPDNKALNDPSLKNALSKMGDIKGLKSNGETLDFDGVKIKRCPPKEFTKETLDNLYNLYLQASSDSNEISKSFKEIDALLKDETTPEQVIKDKKENKEKIPFIEYFINTVDPIIKQNLNSFNAVKKDECKSIEEAFMFADLENFSMDNIKVEKFGGAQSLRTKMSYSFAEPGKDVPEKFSKVHEGFFTQREQFDYVGLYEDNKKKLEGRFKKQYDNFFKYIYDQYDRFDKSNDEEWVKAHPFDSKKPHSNAEKEKYERDRLDHKLEHFGGNEANKVIEKLAEKLYFSDGKYHFPLLKETKEAGPNDKKSVFSLIANEGARNAAWDYFQENRENPEFLASLAEFDMSFSSLRVVQGISQNDLGFEHGTEVSYKNCAMTAVAKALDMDVIADSYKMNIVDNGKTIEGVFMETANGVDLINIKDPIKREKIFNNGFDDPRFLKSVSDLQVLDYICGNVDRHHGNLCYKLDEKGEKVIGICGFDNDSSFGSRMKDDLDTQHLLPPVNYLKAIDEKTANMVKNLTEDKLRGILAPFGVKESEILNSIDRLKQVKDAINVKANDKTKLQDPMKISILNEQGWEKATFKDMLKGEGYFGNTFNEIKKPIDDFLSRKFFATHDKEGLETKAYVMGVSLNTLNDDLAKYEKDLIGAKSKWNNSGEYKRLIGMIASLKDQDNHIDSFDFREKLDGLSKTQDQMSNYMKTINKIKESANKYLEHKQKDIEQNKLDDISKKKVEIVNNLLNTLNQKETIINVDFKKYQRACKENIDINAMDDDYNLNWEKYKAAGKIEQKQNSKKLVVFENLKNDFKQNKVAAGAVMLKRKI